MLEVTARLVEVEGPEDFEAAFAAMRADGTQALQIVPDPITATHRI